MAVVDGEKLGRPALIVDREAEPRTIARRPAQIFGDLVLAVVLLEKGRVDEVELHRLQRAQRLGKGRDDSGRQPHEGGPGGQD